MVCIDMLYKTILTVVQVIMPYKVIQMLESVHEILKCDHSN